jgi:hypothetical protein
VPHTPENLETSTVQLVMDADFYNAEFERKKLEALLLYCP